jgi:hypothetical protein
VLTDRFTDRPAGIRVFDFPGVEALAESKRRLRMGPYRTCGPVRPVHVVQCVSSQRLALRSSVLVCARCQRPCVWLSVLQCWGSVFICLSVHEECLASPVVYGVKLE